MDSLRLKIIEAVLMGNDEQLSAMARMLGIDHRRRMTSGGRTVTVSEAGRILGISRQTVYAWVKAGRLTILPGTSRILRKQVDEIAEGGCPA
jgi:excisionase family DNA binding protein